MKYNGDKVTLFAYQNVVYGLIQVLHARFWGIL